MAYVVLLVVEDVESVLEPLWSIPAKLPSDSKLVDARPANSFGRARASWRDMAEGLPSRKEAG